MRNSQQYSSNTCHVQTMWEGDKWEPPTSQVFCGTVFTFSTVYIQCLSTQRSHKISTIWCWTQVLLDLHSRKVQFRANNGQMHKVDGWWTYQPIGTILLLPTLSKRTNVWSSLMSLPCVASISSVFCFTARPGLALPKDLCVTTLSIKFVNVNRLKRIKYAMHHSQALDQDKINSPTEY